MKAEIHPDYHTINVVMTDGTKYQTRSTWGKEGDTINLDVDPLNHPAWQGGTGKVVEKGQLSKFEKRFAGFGLSATAHEKNEADAAAKAAKAPKAKEEKAKK
jgi:large subunit ribosomal protein L31